ncbi:MAG: 4-(cytidine 5'-diphospho)-2-C-methyl-D-erythritol kinase [Candidatus Binatia bacterium]
MKIRAPAKINLRLRVVGKRADGYHLLDTIMAPVSLYDEIEIRKLRMAPTHKKSGDELIKITCDDPAVPADEENLAYRAAQLIMKDSRKAQAVHIHIRKSIPLGAGLGGGSTDAAATLVGLNRLLKLRLSLSKLEKMALSLGADVPFFIRARPARARGIGERLSRLGRLPRIWSVIIYPGFPVSTAWVYRNVAAKLTKPIVNTSIATSLKSFDKLSSLLENDLESVTLRRYPEIGVLKQKLLREGAPRVLMSGSGSSVFGIFASKRAALTAFERLRKEEGARAFLVHVLN